ncbi:hypothetical protein B0H14DRAFT_3764554 [Mycena olivaceomarginata]|nr:hypothetical protein B0H14DRAFT_3764554 [Mycena olivaceomarginata]
METHTCPYCDKTHRTIRYIAYAAESDDDTDSSDDSNEDENGIEESDAADREIIVDVEEPVGTVSYLSDDEDEPNLSANPPQSNDSPIGLPFPTAEPEPGAHTRKRQRATVEEVEDEDERYVQDFPEHFEAGKGMDECKTYFETLRDNQKAEGSAPWYPFESEEEWELAQWLITSGLSQTKTDDYLKLNVVCERIKPSFSNNSAFLKFVDALPSGPQWYCNTFELVGDECEPDQQPKKETVEMWYRNPIECMKELLGNPSFAGKQGYKPIRVYKRFKDGQYSNQEFTEMWTADWWWAIQELLPRGSTLAPIIISTDKTQLTRFSGDKQAWPVYLTIGNIEKGVQRSPSSRATILSGYIPVTKLEIFSQAKRAAVSHQLFHDCMRVILEPLQAAGVDGVEMDCADGFVQRMFPILAAYIADYPEQCLVACCRENSCPQCLVQPKQRGEPLNSTLRNPGETLQVIVDQSQNQFPAKFVDQNLRPINPFWADFPHCDIFSSMTPTFFTSCTMWTGNEHKNMEKVFLGILAQATDPAVQCAVAAIIDFIYYAHFETHCDESLSRLDAAWAAFHQEKSIFLKLEIRKHFDINKLHKLKHYVDSIRSHGTADGFNTENTERLHIDFAQAGYRATNKVHYTHQMTVWLARQEAVYKFGTYLQWAIPGYIADSANDADNNDLEEEEEGSAVLARHLPPDDPDSDDKGELGHNTPSRSLTYHVPKNPRFPRIPAATIVSEFHAPDFLIKLDDFLKSNSINPHHPPDVNSTFPVYKRLSIPLPQISEVASHVVYDTVRAVRAEPGKMTAKGIMIHPTLIIIQFMVNSLYFPTADNYRSS